MLENSYLSGLFDDNTSVGGQTSKGHHNMAVEDANFLYCPIILKFSDGFFLHSKYDDFFTANSNGCGTFFDCFLSVFDL